MIGKYDINKDNLYFEYSTVDSCYSLYKDGNKVPIQKLNKKSYFELVKKNLECLINNGRLKEEAIK